MQISTSLFLEPFYDSVWQLYILVFIFLFIGGGVPYTYILRRRFENLKLIISRSQCEVNRSIVQQTDKLAKVYSTFRSLLENGRTPTLADWKTLDDSLQQAYPQFREVLLSHHHLTDMEYRLSMLIKVDFPPKDIASLLCRSREAVSAIRRRLSKRVLGEEYYSPKQWDSYILSL